MIDAIWQQVEGVPNPGGAGHMLNPPVARIPPPAPRSDASPGYPFEQQGQDLEWARFTDESDRFWSARWESPGDEEVSIGAIMLPFGLASCGLMLIVGLIVIISGAAQNASWDGEPRHAH